MRCRLLLGLVVVACRDPSPGPPRTAPIPATVVDDTCAPVPGFAPESPIAEASGAVATVVDGVAALIVVADSGNDGAYQILDPETGTVREAGRLPLGRGASDDLEGLAAPADGLVAITSSGWVRRWRRDRRGFSLVDGPYPIAPLGDWACKGPGINCAANYEGLCLTTTPRPGQACQGFAASKARGELACVVADGDRLRLDPSRRLEIGPPETLTGCELPGDGEVLWVGHNLFGASRVERIRGWDTPGQVMREDLGSLGPGFPEALAVDDAGALYRFSDTRAAPSLQGKFRCRAQAQ